MNRIARFALCEGESREMLPKLCGRPRGGQFCLPFVRPFDPSTGSGQASSGEPQDGRQHGTLRFSVFGFFARSAKKPNTIKEKYRGSRPSSSSGTASRGAAEGKNSILARDRVSPEI